MPMTPKQWYIAFAAITIMSSFIATVIVASINIGQIIHDVQMLRKEVDSHSAWIEEAPPDAYEDLVRNSLDLLREDVRDLKGAFMQMTIHDSQQAADIRVLKDMVERHMAEQKNMLHPN